MAHADPSAEQADGTRNKHQTKMVNERLGRHAEIRL
jgi:hypothetical protein